MRLTGIVLGLLRPLRGSGCALGQPDAFGAGESVHRPSNNRGRFLPRQYPSRSKKFRSFLRSAKYFFRAASLPLRTFVTKRRTISFSGME